MLKPIGALATLFFLNVVRKLRFCDVNVHILDHRIRFEFVKYNDGENYFPVGLKY